MNKKSDIEIFIVEAVKSKRVLLKKTQEDIGKILHVSTGYIGQVESKKSKSMYSYEQLNQLAKFFKCSPKDFFPEKDV